MKASELGAKAGDYIARGRDIVAHKVFESNGKLMAAVTKIAHLTGDDWQLLQPRPELGEAHRINEDELCMGETYFLDVGQERPVKATATASEDLASMLTVANKNRVRAIYRDPRPLPALPKREPTLREKILAILDGASILPGTKAMMATELAALLENHDE